VVQSSPMAGEPIENQAEALERVEPEDDSRTEAADWAADGLLEGRTPEEVVAGLIELGWDPEQAEEMTELARKATRRQRGVVTRDDVAEMVERKHRHATSGMSAFFRSGLGLFSLFGFLTQLRETIRLNRKLKQMKQRRGE
jgi:MoxR-like ATPase